MIVCRSAAELERMRDAGRLVGEVLAELMTQVAPGVTTADLDDLAEKRILKAGATPAFKGYHGYPATICASINEEVIHGIPSGRRVLNEGDVISIDVGASLDGYFGDSAITLPVGQVSEDAASYALKVLRMAGLVRGRKVGRSVCYRLAEGFPHELLEHCLRDLLRISPDAGPRIGP